MSKVIDMTGQTWGQLTVLERAENDKHGKAQWLCQCECGNKKIIAGAALRKGLTISCGCNKLKKIKEYNKKHTIDETGNIYGYLTVISRNEDPELAKDGRAMWNCQCKCGNICVIPGKLLRNGHVTSCGCRKQSLGEEAIENILLQNNFNYAKEYLIQTRKELIYQHHKSRFDFAIFDNNNNLKYFIEFDGSQHFEENIDEDGLGWNSKEKYEKTHERDMIKNQWCIENHIPLIRIPYTHLSKLDLTDLVLETSTFIINPENEKEENNNE